MTVGLRANVAGMSEQLRAYTRAIFDFDHVVRQARPGDWDKPSPCEGWTARHVLGHVNALQRYMDAAMHGQPPTMNPMENPDQHAGDDPAATWRATRDTILATLDQPGVLQKVVTTFRGEQKVDDMIGFNVGDTSVHAWDLAQAFGIAITLDASNVERVYEKLKQIDFPGMRSPTVFGPAIDVADADLQTRLLAFTGRSV